LEKGEFTVPNAENRKSREAFQSGIQCAQVAGYSDWLPADEAALDYIATRIAPKFGVSAEAIAKRLRVETLWSPTVSQPRMDEDEHGFQLLAAP